MVKVKVQDQTPSPWQGAAYNLLNLGILCKLGSVILILSLKFPIPWGEREK